MDSYELGKKGIYEDIIKNYKFVDVLDLLRGLRDRNDLDLSIKIYYDCNILFSRVCQVGIRPLIDYVLTYNTDKDLFEHGLSGACSGGHVDLVELFIQKGACVYNTSLKNACKGGHINLVKYIANIHDITWDWNDAFSTACQYNHIYAAKYMVEKGANNWYEGLKRACRYDRKDIVDYIIVNACENGNIDLIKHIVNEYINGNDDYLNYRAFGNDYYLNRIFGFTCKAGHIDIAKYIIEKGANNWNYGLCMACRYDSRNVVDYIIKEHDDRNNSLRSLIPFNIDWNGGLCAACRGGSYYLVCKMINLGANDYHGGLANACEFGNINCVKLMILLGAYPMYRTVCRALMCKYWHIVEYLISLGMDMIVSSRETGYYKYLLNKLNKPRSQVCHDTYEVLSDLIALYS